MVYSSGPGMFAWPVFSSIALSLKAAIPGIDEATFHELATLAKLNCPVSKVLNAEITLDAELV